MPRGFVPESSLLWVRLVPEVSQISHRLIRHVNTRHWPGVKELIDNTSHQFLGENENNPPKRKSLSTQIPAFFSLRFVFLRLRASSRADIFVFLKLLFSANLTLSRTVKSWTAGYVGQWVTVAVPMSLTVEMISGLRESAIPVASSDHLSSIIGKLSQSSFAWCCVTRNRKLQFLHTFLRIYCLRRLTKWVTLFASFLEQTLASHIWSNSSLIVATLVYNLINRHFFLSP